MQNVFLFLLTTVALTINLNAQDVIIKRNGDDIEAKVLEILDSEIKYKKFNFLDGPTYTEKKSEILIIRYENGSKDIFTEKDNESAKGRASSENLNLPNRLFSIRGGLSLANNSNPTPTPTNGRTVKNNIYAFSLNAFSLNKQFSLSLSVVPFDYIEERTYTSNYLPLPVTAQAKGVAILSEFYWHYIQRPKYSIYSGLGAGIQNIKLTCAPDPFNESGSRVNESFHLTILGSEYYVTPNIGLYSELGYGKKGNLSVGIQFKF